MAHRPVSQGILLKTVELDGIRLTETVHEPRLKLEPHSHELINLTFVLKGSFIESFERSSLELCSNSVFLEPAGLMHSDHYGNDGAHSLIAEFGYQWVELVKLDPTLLQNPFHVTGLSRCQ